MSSFVVRISFIAAIADSEDQSQGLSLISSNPYSSTPSANPVVLSSAEAVPKVPCIVVTVAPSPALSATYSAASLPIATSSISAL